MMSQLRQRLDCDRQQLLFALLCRHKPSDSVVLIKHLAQSSCHLNPAEDVVGASEWKYFSKVIINQYFLCIYRAL